ncbi:MAG: bifunctional oligoribonuclease/PAP phosphatase NrnA, partial [Candidatus Omnitrophica bacterium]|nr:bifunctional oligoribonuclease/PAP phosphatase NrnA [Candidatus Omnitrophota bacterium]
DDDMPYGYDFLPLLKKIKKFNFGLCKIKFDCFVILDCCSLSRIGQVYKLNSFNKPILNIDHHISNEKFGDINWVEPNASSCCEMIYRLYKRLDIPLDKNIAMLLYVGILTDTGSFRYSNTRDQTHKITAELLQHNLDVAKIYNQIYNRIPFGEMKLLTKILPTIRRDYSGKIAFCQIPQCLLRKQRINIDLGEIILSFCRAIKDVEVAVLFKENLGKKSAVRVNLRSQGKVDVNKIAQFFGGGGHRTASGVTISGTLASVRKRVLKKIEEYLKR